MGNEWQWQYGRRPTDYRYRIEPPDKNPRGSGSAIRVGEYHAWHALEFELEGLQIPRRREFQLQSGGFQKMGEQAVEGVFHGGESRWNMEICVKGKLF